jgi:hypothetical protein
MRINNDELLALFSEEDRREWFALSAEEKAAVRESITQRIPPTDELRELTRPMDLVYR